MSMATDEPRRPDSSALSSAISLIFIGRSKDGLWVARDADTRLEGIFAFKLGALRFARRVAGKRASATMLVTQGLEPSRENCRSLLVGGLRAVRLGLARIASIAGLIAFFALIIGGLLALDIAIWMPHPRA